MMLRLAVKRSHCELRRISLAVGYVMRRSTLDAVVWPAAAAAAVCVFVDQVRYRHNAHRTASHSLVDNHRWQLLLNI